MITYASRPEPTKISVMRISFSMVILSGSGQL